MLVRTEYEGRLTVYRSELLTHAGVPHAFTTRLGGVSQPPYDALNFQPAAINVAHLGETVTPGARSSAPERAQYQAVAENFRRASQAIGASDRQIICVWQVHGTKVCHWPHDFSETRPVENPAVVM